MRAISIFKSRRSSLLALLRKEFLSLMGVVTPFLFDPAKIQNFKISRFAAYPFTLKYQRTIVPFEVKKTKNVWRFVFNIVILKPNL
jgi:hypothetical protein